MATVTTQVSWDLLKPLSGWFCLWSCQCDQSRLWPRVAPWLVVNLCACTLSFSLEKKPSDKRGARGKWWRDGLTLMLVAVTCSRSRWCLGLRVPCHESVFDRQQCGDIKGESPQETHSHGSWGERHRVAGAGWAAQLQREGHHSYAGDGACGAELRGFENRDEPSLKSAVLRLWWKN